MITIHNSSFSALMLLVEKQKGRPSYKKLVVTYSKYPVQQLRIINKQSQNGVGNFHHLLNNH